MENILFKIAYPAEFHAQTAVECAVKLHPLWQAKQHNIVKIEMITHEAAMRIINKQGPLKNPADRDHCMQYMVAVALLTGGLRAENYEDSFANNSQIDKIRAMIDIAENKQFSKDYFDLTKRAIANGIKFVYNDNTTSDWVVIEYPLGHASRRTEAIPLLLEKFKQNTKSYFSAKKIDTLMNLIVNNNSFLEYSVVDFMALLTE
jgi:2-methylcitrate dehydratase